MGDALIFRRDFGYAPDQALLLRNAEYARRITYGPDWSRIRLGFLYSLADDRISRGTNLLGCPLFFGLGDSFTSIGTFATQNFLGLSLIGSAVPGAGLRTLTYVAGTLGNDYYTPTVGNVFRKYGANYAVSANNAAGAYFPMARNPTLVASENRRAVLVMEITRPRGGSGNATVSVFCTTTGQVALDFRADHLWAALDFTGTPTLLGTAMTVLQNAVAVTVGEEFGGLDTVRLYWGRNAPQLEVWAIGANLMLDGELEVGGAYESFMEYAGAGTLTDPPVSNFGTFFLSGTGVYPLPHGFGSPTLVSSGTTYSNPAPIIINPRVSGFAGTQVGCAGTLLGGYDPFETYDVGTVIPYGMLVNGTIWPFPGTIVNYTNPAPEFGLAGTCGWPYDTFETYGTGTVNTGETLNAGTFWLTYGSIMPG